MKLNGTAGLALSLMISSCNLAEKKGELLGKEVRPGPQKKVAERALDSLTAWNRFDEVLYRNGDDYAAYANSKSRFAVLCDGAGKQLVTYRKAAGEWRFDSTYAWTDECFQIEAKDMNGDGRFDLRIIGSANMNGNCDVYVLLCDSAGRLHYRPSWHDGNLDYDPVRNLLYAHWTGSRYGNTKLIYHWVADSLQLLEELTWDGTTDRDAGAPRHFAYRNGRKVSLPIPDDFYNAMFPTPW